MAKDQFKSHSVSVVTITLQEKEEDFPKLEKTLLSLSKQRLVDEVVVCFWGEDDIHLRNKINQLYLPFDVKLVRSPQKGFSIQRNFGVQNSRGDIIAFVDDDMTIQKGALDKVVSKLDDTKIATCGLVLPERTENIVGICQQIFVHPGGGWQLLKQATFSHYQEELEIPFLHTCFCAMKRETWENVKFSDDMVWGSEDTDFSIRAKRIFPNKRIILIPDAVAYHPPRKSLDEVAKWMFRYGRARQMIFQKYGIPPFEPFLPKLIAMFVVLLFSTFTFPIITPWLASSFWFFYTFHLLSKRKFEFEKATSHLTQTQKLEVLLSLFPVFTLMSLSFDLGRLAEFLSSWKNKSSERF